MQPINRELNIYLAEDDEADCLLLKAIDELPVKVKLTIVRDGQQLVELLTQVNTLPVVFLDLNMPCKMGLPH
jgi:CheY-like chemotaxis protein